MDNRKQGEVRMNLQKLAEEINECYGPPFLPKGFVRARVTDYGTLWFDIGDRNGKFDEEGKRTGSGTAMGEGKKWAIGRITWAK